MIEIAHDVLRQWLDVTLQLSPLGDEASHIDWDVVIRMLLDAE
ncbi:hypothetical protein [Streptomyces sp. RK9]